MRNRPITKIKLVTLLKYSIREGTSAKSVAFQIENKTHYQYIASVALTYANKRINGSCLQIYLPVAHLRHETSFLPCFCSMGSSEMWMRY